MCDSSCHKSLKAHILAIHWVHKSQPCISMRPHFLKKCLYHVWRVLSLGDHSNYIFKSRTFIQPDACHIYLFQHHISWPLWKLILMLSHNACWSATGIFALLIQCVICSRSVREFNYSSHILLDSCHFCAMYAAHILWSDPQEPDPASTMIFCDHRKRSGLQAC